jgi:peptidoglycan/LPS O-acetylase OafA/YrhL
VQITVWSDDSGVTRERSRAIPGLDGLRALSIAGVVAGHWADTAGGAGAPLLAAIARRGALLGVRTFFVVSGYLITTLLLAELARHGRLRLGRFYVRRTLRIAPAYYAYLAVVGVLVLTHRLASEEGTRWWPAWTFTANAAWTNLWYTGHAWSLSVEEQFYLAWPALLVALGRRRAAWALLLVAATAPLARVAIAMRTGNAGLAYGYNFDFLAAGCALAVLGGGAPTEDLVSRVRAALRSRRAATVAAVVAAGMLLAVALASYGAPSLDSASRPSGALVRQLVVSQPVEALALALVVAWCVASGPGPVHRALNAAPLRRVGVLSYSIYLWQQLFLPPGSRTPTLYALAALAGASVISYAFVERPALRLRAALERLAWLRLLPSTGRDGRPGSARLALDGSSGSDRALSRGHILVALHTPSTVEIPVGGGVEHGDECQLAEQER